MFCSRCGQEIAEGGKFCSHCGAAVEVAEPTAEPIAEPVAEPVAEPIAEPVSEPTVEPVAETVVLPAAADAAQTQPPVPAGRRSGRSLAIAAAAVVLLALLIVGAVKLIPALSGGGAECFLYSTEDNELMFRKNLSAKTESTELCDESFANRVLFSDDGKTVYFFRDESDDSFADLYAIRAADAGKKDAVPDKVSSDVSMYNVALPEGGGLLFLKGDSDDTDLFCYDGKESVRIARDVSDFTLGSDQKYVYCSEWDDECESLTLCRIDYKKGGEKETLLKDVSVIYSDYDAETLVYGMDDGSGAYDVYLQTAGGDREKIASGVYAVEYVEPAKSGVKLLYLTCESDEKTLYDFVTDRLADSDRNVKEPQTSDYQTYVQGYWYGYYTTDWDAYNRAREQWYPVANRNSIREALKEESYGMDYYTLHLYEGGNTATVAERVTDYRCDSGSGICLYQKYEGGVEPVADVSELESAWDVYDRLGSGGGAWYQNVNGSESEFEPYGDCDSIGGLYVLNGSEAVISCYSAGEDAPELLVSYAVGQNALSGAKEITDEFIGLCPAKDAKGGDVLYYFTDVGGDGETGDLICYNGGETVIAKEVEGVFVYDDGTAFCHVGESYDSRKDLYEYTLCAVGGDGKTSRIADEVCDWIALGAKSVIYVSDGDLYHWNGKESERLAHDVDSIWAKEYADYISYWCSY